MKPHTTPNCKPCAREGITRTATRLFPEPCCTHHAAAKMAPNSAGTAVTVAVRISDEEWERLEGAV